ncbi:MAG: hypothetical protein ACFNLV_00695 [Prevotella nigrescens]
MYFRAPRVRHSCPTSPTPVGYRFDTCGLLIFTHRLDYFHTYWLGTALAYSPETTQHL